MSDIKAICSHCFKFGTVYEVSKYLLCDEDKNLKQYQSKKVKKPRHIKQVSDKRKVENKDYMVIRNDYLNKNPICECGCNQLSTEIHHKGGRIGDLLIDTFGFMAVNSSCHRLIHDDHKHALDNGYIWSLEFKNNYLKTKK